MAKEKQMQIPTKAFIDIYKLIIALDDYELDYDTKELVKSLETAVESKFEAMSDEDLMRVIDGEATVVDE